VSEPQTLISTEKLLTETNKAQQLTSESQIIVALSIKARSANTAVVRIGPSTVEGKGYPLAAGESVEFDVIDPTRIYLYGNENDGVNWLGLKP